MMHLRIMLNTYWTPLERRQKRDIQADKGEKREKGEKSERDKYVDGETERGERRNRQRQRETERERQRERRKRQTERDREREKERRSYHFAVNVDELEN